MNTSRRQSTVEYDEIDCEDCECVSNPLTWLAAFGLIYWIASILVGFFEAGSDQQLFLWSVISLAFAVVIQFIIIGLSMAKWTMDETLQIFCFKIDKPGIIIIPYTIWILIDLCVHFTVLNHDEAPNVYSIVLLVGHGISLFSISVLFYHFDAGHTIIRVINLLFEWVDLCSQIAVVLFYNSYSVASNTRQIADVFWGFIFVQLIFWMIPITFRVSKDLKKMSYHVLFVDIVTDIPILIVILASGAYQVQFWILIDVVIKIILMARGILNFCMIVFKQSKSPKTQRKMSQEHDAYRF